MIATQYPVVIHYSQGNTAHALCTLTELQEYVNGANAGIGVDLIRCATCQEMLGDCRELAGSFGRIPAEWTLEGVLEAYDADDDDTGAETRVPPTVGVRHATGLVVFTG